MAQLAERSLPIPEELGSNPVIDNFYEHLFTVNCLYIEKTKNKEKEAENCPFLKKLCNAERKHSDWMVQVT